jgi:ketosteroid isomerase-like protein
MRVDSSGDMAMEVGRYSVTIRNQNGTLMAERGKYVKVWRRLGAWLILADCWSRNPPVNQ